MPCPVGTIISSVSIHPIKASSRLNASSFVTYLHFHYNSVIQSNLSLLYFLLRERIRLQFHQRLKPIPVSPQGIPQLASPFISTAYPTERQRNLNNGGNQHNSVIQGDDRIIHTSIREANFRSWQKKLLKKRLMVNLLKPCTWLQDGVVMYCELKRKSETELLCNLKAIFMVFCCKKAEKKQFNIPRVEIDLPDSLAEVSLG